MKHLSLVCTLSILVFGCDSGSASKDDILRIIISLDLENVSVEYGYGDGDGRVTLCTTSSSEGGQCRNTGGPGVETIVNVSYSEGEVFTFRASRDGVQDGTTTCTAAAIAVENGAADVIVFQSGSAMQVQCSGNWVLSP